MSDVDTVGRLRGAGVEWQGREVECLVFTRKDGLLSRVAHDLKLRAEHCRAHLRAVDGGGFELRADIDPASVQVVTAMRDGQEHLGALSSADKEKIASHLRADVLHTRQHAQIHLRLALTEEALGALLAEGAAPAQASGELTLHGQTRGVRLRLAPAERQGAAGWLASAELLQPDFGIKPFSAMMGTLKVQPTVAVTVWLARAPLDAALRAAPQAPG